MKIAPDEAWWHTEAAALLAALQSRAAGLSSAEAEARRAAHGANATVERNAPGRVRLLLRQLKSPLVLILVAGAFLSMALREWTDAVTILLIVGGSAVLGFVQEWRASQALTALRSRLQLSVPVRRDGALRELDVAALVPGDVIELSAGKLVPADGRVLEARGLLVNQASLTGETFPVDKEPGRAAAASTLAERSNCVFQGSSVRSGWAAVLVVRTGGETALADVAARLAAPETETRFEQGVRRFGAMLLRVMLLVVVAVIVANQLLGRPVAESVLFAAALAVGLSPELLPAVLGISLARGASKLAQGGVLVRRLDAIEDLGAMDVLCTDKTGTLTVGQMALAAAVDAAGRPSAEVLRLAWLNASLEQGIGNPIDAALVQAGHNAGLALQGERKVDEIPYDFSRRRLTVVLEQAGQHLLITKGAVEPVLAVCALGEAERTRLAAAAQAEGERGVRVLALAMRRGPAQASYGAEDERELAFAGFLHFIDPPKADARDTVRALERRGVRVKMITGDNRHVAAYVAAQVGLASERLLTGAELAAMRDEALWHRAPRTEVFAEVDPAQKERIVRALQRLKHAVGFLGDGINDAPALHAADVGISVDGAAEVARESADLVLLEPDLEVLERGIAEGRRIFANTLKYIQITISANFGNMVSMAVATPLLPFLPLTATQILLNNFLSDLPVLALAGDRVDARLLARPQRWNEKEVRRFMVTFGLVSSAFDAMLFWLLLQAWSADEPLFHSAWFVFSLLTELAVVLVLRTREPLLQSRPSRALWLATLAVAVVALALPFSGPLAATLGLAAPSTSLLIATVGLLLGYVLATELAKRRFFTHARHAGRKHRGRAGAAC